MLKRNRPPTPRILIVKLVILSSSSLNPVSDGGVGYCISCLENGLQQSQFWVLSPKKLMTIFLVKFWVVASAINNTPPLHPSSVFVSIPDRVNPDYVLRLMLVQKSHVALCFFPLTTSKHQALVLQNKKLSKSKVTGLSSNMILRQVSVVGKLNKSHSFILWPSILIDSITKIDRTA